MLEEKKELKENLKKQKLWRSTALKLIGDPSEEAWEVRQWLLYDEKVGRLRGGINAKILKVLRLNKSRLWFIIRGWVDKWSPLGLYLPGDVLLSTVNISCEDERKWRLINKLEGLCPVETLLSIIGDQSQRAEAVRLVHLVRNDKRLQWTLRADCFKPSS